MMLFRWLLIYMCTKGNLLWSLILSFWSFLVEGPFLVLTNPNPKALSSNSKLRFSLFQSQASKMLNNNYCVLFSTRTMDLLNLENCFSKVNTYKEPWKFIRAEKKPEICTVLSTGLDFYGHSGSFSSLLGNVVGSVP